MTLGPGKYDAVATIAMELTLAEGVVLIVLGGRLGSGFAAQLTPGRIVALPGLLREIADSIETDNLNAGDTRH